MNHTIYIHPSNELAFSQELHKGQLINDFLDDRYAARKTIQEAAVNPRKTLASLVKTNSPARKGCSHYKPNGTCLVLGCSG